MNNNIFFEIEATPNGINSIPENVDSLWINHNDNIYEEIEVSIDKRKNILLSDDYQIKNINDMWIYPLDYTFLNKFKNLRRLRIYNQIYDNCFLDEILNKKIILDKNLEILLCDNYYDFEENPELLNVLNNFQNIKVLHLGTYYDNNYYFNILPKTLEMIIFNNSYNAKEFVENLEFSPDKFINLKTIYINDDYLEKIVSLNTQIIYGEYYDIQQKDILKNYHKDYNQIEIWKNSEDSLDDNIIFV